MAQQRLFNKKVRDLDPAIWSLAHQHELGTLHSTHHTLKYTSHATEACIVSLILSLVFIILSILGILLKQFSFLLLSIFFALLFLILGGLVIVALRTYGNRYLSLWDAGFLYQKRGSPPQIVRWDQIEHIQGNVVNPFPDGQTAFVYQVYLRDGYKMKFYNTFSDPAQLMDNLLDGFARHIALHELTIRPSRDKTFASDFKLDRQGISDKQEALLWQDIQELTIEKGTMAVLKYKSDNPIFEEKRL